MKVYVLVERTANNKYDNVIGVFSSPKKADKLVPRTERRFTCIYSLLEYEIDKKIKK